MRLEIIINLKKIKMKKLAILTVMVLLTITTYGQKNAVSKHFSQYQGDASFTKVSVTNKMFSLFTEIETDDESEQEILAAMAKLKGVKALFTDDAENADLLKRYYDAVATVENDGAFEELMTVEDRRENISFLIREDDGGVIRELLMIIGGPDNFMVMSVYGEIDLSSIGKISKALKIKGMEQFEKVAE